MSNSQILFASFYKTLFQLVYASVLREQGPAYTQQALKVLPELLLLF